MNFHAFGKQCSTGQLDWPHGTVRAHAGINPVKR